MTSEGKPFSNLFSNLSHISSILNEKRYNFESVISPKSKCKSNLLGENEGNFVYNIIKRQEEESNAKKKPKILNKAFIMEEDKYIKSVDRINRVNEKVNSMKKHSDVNNIS
jgi:hypothetical protein